MHVELMLEACACRIDAGNKVVTLDVQSQLHRNVVHTLNALIVSSTILNYHIAQNGYHGSRT